MKIKIRANSHTKFNFIIDMIDQYSAYFVRILNFLHILFAKDCPDYFFYMDEVTGTAQSSLLELSDLSKYMAHKGTEKLRQMSR
jgi:hypothetical protein